MSEFAAAHALPPDGSTPLVKVFPAHKYLPPYRVDKTRGAYRKSCRVSAIDDAPEIAPIPIAAHRCTHTTFYPTTHPPLSTLTLNSNGKSTERRILHYQVKIVTDYTVYSL
jgi:hypothetical protein